MVNLPTRTVLAALAVASFPAVAAAPQPVARLDLPLQFVPALSDEFEGATLDAAKWDPDMPDWGRWSWEPGNVSVAGGSLHMTMRFAPHERGAAKLDYQSGAVRSRGTPLLHGYMEARIKAARRFPGVSTAFWAFRNTPSLWTEIDVVETTQHWKDPQVAYFNTHVMRAPTLDGGEPLHEKRMHDIGADPAQNFHVYSCLWTRSELVWFVDGREVARRANEHWHQPLDIVLSLGLRPPLDRAGSPAGFPATAQVDYVRVWSLAVPPTAR